MCKKIDLFVGFLVTVLWGGNFAIIDLGLRDLDPFALTLMRFVFCAFPLVFFIRRPKDVPLKNIALYGCVFGVGLWWIVNYAMYKGLSAGLSSVFLQFSAFFTILFSCLFMGEKINKVHFVGIILASFGLLMIIAFSDDTSTINGIILVMVAAVAWAICNIIIKFTKPADMVAFIVWSSLFAVPAILIMTVCFKGWGAITTIPASLTVSSAFSVLFQAYITTIMGYMIWNNLMKKYPATQVAPLSLFVPISGVITSYLFLDEKLSSAQTLSVGVVILGILIFLNSGVFLKFLNSKSQHIKIKNKAEQ